ncbi:class I SAM-dependent methyltransferase [Streptomyces sp. NPDC059378]|uniref:class I SAM-dependent methyltransferase n=1 Tax=Streptomyces sp. NPDC059378 TaxID=3346815 RepID=UPI0036CA0879
MVKGTYATDYGLIRIDRTGQAEAFDAIGRRYDEAFRHKDGRLSAGAWLIASLLPGSRVLDLGCGTGLPTTRRPADAGLEAIGVDLSPGMLRLARESVPGATFHRLDLAYLRPAGPHDLDRFAAVAAFFSPYEVIEAAGFGILRESSYTYAPAVADVPPEEQVFLCCRRRD